MVQRGRRSPWRTLQPCDPLRHRRLSAGGNASVPTDINSAAEDVDLLANAGRKLRLDDAQRLLSSMA
jgi:hypothetical protein